MKKAITLCLASVLLLATTIPARADNPQMTGVWRATLHDQPCILMNVHDNEGKLSGNIIFYLLKLENGAWHATGSEPIPLIHPRIEGNYFIFEVVHAKKNGSADPADQQLQTFRMGLAGKDKGIFSNALEGQDLIMQRSDN
ncbi:MAG TPA: hypothetical protein VKH40_01970 [Alloacidobacterium sp.]|nr:hypothetical protein [Alloacidobacterium sp.]